MDPEFINSVFALFDRFGAILNVLWIAGLMAPVYQSDAYETLQGVLVNMEKGTFISGEQRIRPNLRRTKTIFGNREHHAKNECVLFLLFICLYLTSSQQLRAYGDGVTSLMSYLTDWLSQGWNPQTLVYKARGLSTTPQQFDPACRWI